MQHVSPNCHPGTLELSGRVIVSSENQPQKLAARLFVRVFVLVLKTVAVIEAASHGIIFEYVEKKGIPQAHGVIHQGSTQTLSLMIRMHENCANLIADQCNKASHRVL